MLCTARGRVGNGAGLHFTLQTARDQLCFIACTARDHVVGGGDLYLYFVLHVIMWVAVGIHVSCFVLRMIMWLAPGIHTMHFMLFAACDRMGNGQDLTFTLCTARDHVGGGGDLYFYTLYCA